MRRVSLLIFWFWLPAFLALAPVAAAQDAAALLRQDGTADVPLAPIVIDGDTLFSVRGLSVYPAERRARDAEARIRRLAADHSIPPDALTIENQGARSRIVANGQPILVVLDEDAALEGVSRDIVAQLYRDRIAAAIAAYRQAREPALLWRRAGQALAATVIALLAIVITGWLFRRIRRIIEARYRARVHNVSIQNFHIVTAEQIWQGVVASIRTAWAIGALGLVYVYLQFVLMLFPWTRGVGLRLFETAMAPIETLGENIVAVIPNLIFLAILFVIVRGLIRLMQLFFESVARGTVRLQSFEPEWAPPTFKLLRVMLIALGLVVALPYLPGSSSAAFQGISLFFGIIVSLGSSSFIANVIAGFSLAYRRAFKVGDRVRIGDHMGEVMEMRLQVTHLRSVKNEEVVIPNSKIVANEVLNFSTLARARGLILHATVGIGYETPWRQVEAMLLEAAKRTPGLLPDPSPFVLELGLGDFAVTYEINVYCETPERMLAIYADLRRNILDVFNEYGVQIMTPAYERDPEQPKLVPKQEWYAAPARPPGPDPANGA
jgi:small-conductance mechanosensitive channel